MGWWTWVMKSISASIMEKTNLHEAIAISTALSHSGHRLNGGLQNPMVFPNIRFIYHLKECEFRFNHRKKELYDKILSLLSENPL